MPYGVPKEAGGDTPQNDARMERMVSALQKKGHSKESALAISKVTLFQRKRIAKR